MTSGELGTSDRLISTMESNYAVTILELGAVEATSTHGDGRKRTVKGGWGRDRITGIHVKI